MDEDINKCIKHLNMRKEKEIDRKMKEIELRKKSVEESKGVVRKGVQSKPGGKRVLDLVGLLFDIFTV